MKLAFVAQFNIRNINHRSGTPYHMTRAMEQEGIELDYICPLKTKNPWYFKLKRSWGKVLCGQHESSRWQIQAAKQYGLQVKEMLKDKKVDGVMAHILPPLAYLETNLPTYLWIDVLYASHLGFHPRFNDHSASTIHQANAITHAFLDSCKLAIFSSEWAARGAIDIYGADKSKIKVVPFGANLDYQPTFAEVKGYIQKRSRDVIKLLFMGKPWDAKGGDIALATANALHAAGHKVELNIVGALPPAGTVLPSYVQVHGFISKHDPINQQRLLTLLHESHFLIVPTRAEAFGLVFCEASAFGVPSLTTYVGGIPVKDNINGMTFPLHAPISAYCNVIVDLMHDRARYEALALSSFHEYETRLNWKVAVDTVKKLIQETR